MLIYLDIYPSSLWMGGAWEALIKSVKRILKAITSDCLFTEQALHTFICEVQSILNNRPMKLQVKLSTITNWWPPVTSCVGIMHQVYFETTKSSIEKCGVWFKHATNMFWSRWLIEYLQTLVQRWTWNYQSQNLNVGNPSVFQAGNIPRSYWPLGRITETYPGVDGVIQTVKVKTSSNEPVRPAQQLCFIKERKGGRGGEGEC